ncbi:MAG: carbohydrate kinase family protein [Oscillospiraceae bacterium]
MARIIFTGHASCDIPFRPVDREVFDVDTWFAKEINVLTGGDALNATVNLYKLGMGDSLKFVSVVGDDTFGKITTDYLKERNIDISGIKVKPECSSIVSVALIESSGERHFVFYGNSARNISVEDVIENITPDTEFIHIGSLMSLDMLEHDNLRRLFQYAKERGIHTSFDVTYDDTGEWLGKIEAGLPYTDIFFASFDEAVSISGGITDPTELAAFFKKYGIGKFVLKLGKDGCYATDYTNNAIRLPTYAGVPVVDTTGAGDAFVSAYMYGVLNDLSMEECCILGNVNGSLAIGAVGSTAGTGTVEQLKAFILSHGALTVDSDSLISKLK